MSEMREELTLVGCDPLTHSYLGDGVYCGIDSARQVWLLTNRFGVIHKIALELEVLGALFHYANTTLKHHTAPHEAKPQETT
jgi:hypothetical protein